MDFWTKLLETSDFPAHWNCGRWTSGHDRPLEHGYTGPGIGLTLVKSLVEMHGGGVEVDSGGPNQGSEFHVRLPVRAETATVDGESRISPEKCAVVPPQRRVLIVDDNKAAADMLALIVRTLGHQVRTANDGHAAIDVAGEFCPHVVLMDLGMPRMNGYDAARHIRQETWGKDMLLVALTGWGQDEDKQRTKEAGFDFHLVKPAEPAELQRLIEGSGRTV